MTVHVSDRRRDDRFRRRLDAFLPAARSALGRAAGIRDR
jgi:hypothetical protein